MKLLHYFLIGSVPLTDLDTWQPDPENVKPAKHVESILPGLTCLEVKSIEEFATEMIDDYDQSFA